MVTGPDTGQVAAEVFGLALRTPTLPPAKHTHCWVLGGGRLVVVDPGSARRDELHRLLAHLRDREGHGATVAAVLLTHHHPDHVGGALGLHRALGLPILAHPATAARLSFPVQGHLQDGDPLPTDGLPWTVLHTPGHAPGHLCLWRPRDALLVAGDMVAGTGTILVDPKDGSMADYLTSLQRLLGLAPGLTLPAHGPVIHDGTHHLAATLAHRQERSAAVVQQVARGVQTPLAIARKVYVDVSWLALPLATRNVLSTLVHLEQQGRVRRDPRGRWRLA